VGGYEKERDEERVINTYPRNVEGQKMGGENNKMRKWGVGKRKNWRTGLGAPPKKEPPKTTPGKNTITL